MRYIKTFPNHAAYMEFFDTDFEKPNVSYCIAENEVHYNPLRTYKFVDLGLPSGTLWAEEDIMNENGEVLYFAWGETTGYTKDEYLSGASGKTFDLDGYAFYDTVEYDDGEQLLKAYTTISGLTKYHSIPYSELMWAGIEDDPSTGYQRISDPDNKTTLDPEDDAACVLYGDGWSMPTLGDYQELAYYTTVEWNYDRDANQTTGYTLTSLINGNKLTFNMRGLLYYDGAPDYDDYMAGNFCSTMDPVPFHEGNANTGVGYFGGSKWGRYTCNKELGMPVRPVKTENHEKHAHIDLNLPSGTLWANDFIRDASGNILYFAWGETTGYTKEQIENGEREFTKSEYAFYTYDPNEDDYVLTKYDASDGKLQLDIEDDAARAYWGEGWQMPTGDQLYELFSDADSLQRWYHWDEEPRERLAYLMDGDSDNLQLGTTGYVEDASCIDGVETDIYCWSTDIGMYIKSLPDPGKAYWNVAQAYQVHFADGNSGADRQQCTRHMGLPILPVRSYTAARYDFVDLGLPSGTLWATEDVKDSSGNSLLFAWADCEGHDSSYEFTQDNYKYGRWEEDQTVAKGGEAKGGTRSMTYVMTKYNNDDGLTQIDPTFWNNYGITTDDMAFIWCNNCGDLYWCVPTSTQCQELFDNTVVSVDESTGMFVLTSEINGKQITFSRQYDEINDMYYSNFWTSDMSGLYNKKKANAGQIYEFMSLAKSSRGALGTSMWSPDRWTGLFVRPVRYSVDYLKRGVKSADNPWRRMAGESAAMKLNDKVPDFMKDSSTESPDSKLEK